MGEVLDRAIEVGHRDDVCVGDLLKAFGSASFLPLMLLPAAAVVSPLSGIPVFSSICGLTIFLISVQMAVGKRYAWLPRWLRRRRIAGPRLQNGLQRVRPMATWLDRHAHQRLRILFFPPLNILLPLFCALCGGLMPFLELLPFTSSLLGTAVVLTSVGLLTRDGLWVLAAQVPFVAAVGLIMALVG